MRWLAVVLGVCSALWLVGAQAAEGGRCPAGWGAKVKCGWRIVEPFPDGTPQRVPACSNANRVAVTMTLIMQDGTQQEARLPPGGERIIGKRSDQRTPQRIYIEARPKSCP